MERACVPILPDNNPLPHIATRDAKRRGGGCGTGRVLEATEQKEGPSPWWISLESQPGMASTATNPFSLLPIFRIKAPRSLPTCNPVCFCKASLWWLEKRKIAAAGRAETPRPGILGAASRPPRHRSQRMRLGRIPFSCLQTVHQRVYTQPASAKSKMPRAREIGCSLQVRSGVWFTN